MALCSSEGQAGSTAAQGATGAPRGLPGVTWSGLSHTQGEEDEDAGKRRRGTTDVCLRLRVCVGGWGA
jgi:hypothetical protein